MKHSLQLKLSQHLTLTPQLQQSIRLLQLSTLELNQEIERFLQDNPLLEREEEEGEEGAAAAVAATADAAPEPPADVYPRRRSTLPRSADHYDDRRHGDAPDVPEAAELRTGVDGRIGRRDEAATAASGIEGEDIGLPPDRGRHAEPARAPAVADQPDCKLEHRDKQHVRPC